MNQVMEDTDLRDQIDHAIPCGGMMHSSGRVGHDDGPAKFALWSPCSCPARPVFQCAGRVAFMRQHSAGRIGCSRCRQSFPIELWRIIPI